jgi:uncharacterized protein
VDDDDDFLEFVAIDTRVPSPCVNVCSLDPATGWCRGCRRTAVEIGAWPDADDSRRLAILEAVEARRGPA